MAPVYSEPACFPLCVCFLVPPSSLHGFAATWEVWAYPTPQGASVLDISENGACIKLSS